MGRKTRAIGGRSVCAYRRKQIIFAQGDPADAVYCLEKGQVKLAVVSEHGRSGIVVMLKAGDFFGEGCLAGQPVRTATASAMTEVSAVRITRQAMIRLVREKSKFAQRFMAYLLSRNTRIEEDLIDQLVNSSEKRLARMLLRLARPDTQGQAEARIPKVSQEALAEMVGTTRPRVSSLMNKFRKLGFIEYNGGLRVHSSLVSVLQE